MRRLRGLFAAFVPDYTQFYAQRTYCPHQQIELKLSIHWCLSSYPAQFPYKTKQVSQSICTGLVGSERVRRHPHHRACSMPAFTRTASPAVPALMGSGPRMALLRLRISYGFESRAARFSATSLRPSLPATSSQKFSGTATISPDAPARDNARFWHCPARK